MEQAINSFQKGLQLDNHPISQNNDVLTDALNATFVTMNDNEGVLLNDMGNAKVNGAFLDPGYVPVGIKEYGGIIYLAAYNPVTNRSLIGSFPSPERLINPTSINSKNFSFSLFWDNNIEELNWDEETKIYRLKRNAILIELTSDLFIHAGDKFVINSEYIWKNKKFITNFNNIKKDKDLKIDKVNSPKNNYYTLSIGVINSLNNFVDITKNLIRFDGEGNRIPIQNKSELYIFNEGYFINPKIAVEEDYSNIKDLKSFATAENLNTYSYKLIGPLYLKIQFNHIKNIELNIIPQIEDNIIEEEEEIIHNGEESNNDSTNEYLDEDEEYEEPEYIDPSDPDIPEPELEEDCGEVDDQDWNEVVSFNYTNKELTVNEGTNPIYKTNTQEAKFPVKIRRSCIYEPSPDRIEFPSSDDKYPFEIIENNKNIILSLKNSENDDNNIEYKNYNIKIYLIHKKGDSEEEAQVMSYDIYLYFTGEEKEGLEEEKIIVNLETIQINLKEGETSELLYSYITNLNQYPGLKSYIDFEELIENTYYTYDSINKTITAINSNSEETSILCKWLDSEIYEDGNKNIQINITSPDPPKPINKKISLIVEEIITYNCPDGVVNPSENNDIDYYSYYEGEVKEGEEIGEVNDRLKGYHLFYDYDNKKIHKGVIISEENKCKYDKITNEYELTRSKKFELEDKLKEDKIINYKLFVPVTFPITKTINDEDEKYEKTIILNNFTYNGNLNTELINSGKLFINAWRFYNNIEERMTLLTYDVESYPLYGKEFDKLKFELSDVNNSSFLKEIEGSSINGSHTILLSWDELELNFRKLYKVKIKYKCGENNEKVLDDNKYFILTTELFNNSYSIENNQYIHHYGDPTSDEQIIKSDLLKIKFSKDINIYNSVSRGDIQNGDKLLSNETDLDEHTFEISQIHNLKHSINSEFSILNEELYPDYVKLKNYKYKISDVKYKSNISNNNRKLKVEINNTGTKVTSIKITNTDILKFKYTSLQEDIYINDSFRNLNDDILKDYVKDILVYGRTDCYKDGDNYKYISNCSNSKGIDKQSTESTDSNDVLPFATEEHYIIPRQGTNYEAVTTRNISSCLNSIYNFFNSNVSDLLLFLYLFDRTDDPKSYISQETSITTVKPTTSYSRVLVRTNNNKWAYMNDLYSPIPFLFDFIHFIKQFYEYTTVFCYKNKDMILAYRPILSNNLNIIEYNDDIKLSYIINFTDIELETKTTDILNFTYDKSIQTSKDIIYRISISEVFKSYINKIRNNDLGNIYIKYNSNNKIDKTIVIDSNGNELNSNNAYRFIGNELTLYNKYKCNTEILSNTSGYNLLLFNSNELPLSKLTYNINYIYSLSIFSDKRIQLNFDKVLKVDKLNFNND